MKKSMYRTDEVMRSRRPVDLEMARYLNLNNGGDEQDEMDLEDNQELCNERLDQVFVVPGLRDNDPIEVTGLSKRNLDFYLGLDSCRWS